MRFLLVVLATVFALSGCKEEPKPPIDYKGFVKSYTLSELCSSNRPIDKEGCTAYILGAIDLQASLSAEIGEDAYCRSFNTKDAVNTVSGYMKSHQDKSSYPAGLIVYLAMEDAYGCTEKQ
nr:putative integron gene cassette protein [uncultured bacterium]